MLTILLSNNVAAQISMTATPTSYSQNFDGLSATSPSGNVTWTDNVTIRDGLPTKVTIELGLQEMRTPAIELGVWLCIGQYR
jgi:hypothetical protein